MKAEANSTRKHQRENDPGSGIEVTHNLILSRCGSRGMGDGADGAPPCS